MQLFATVGRGMQRYGTSQVLQLDALSLLNHVGIAVFSRLRLDFTKFARIVVSVGETWSVVGLYAGFAVPWRCQITRQIRHYESNRRSIALAVFKKNGENLPVSINTISNISKQGNFNQKLFQQMYDKLDQGIPKKQKKLKREDVFLKLRNGGA